MAADAVLTFAAEGILNKVLSLPAQEFSLVWGFKAQLGKLKQSLTDVERFLVDVADNPQGRPKSIEEWVKKLKDVAEDAEDVLDEFEYEVARRKVEIQNHIKKKVCTARMNLHDEVDLEDYVSRPDKISAAEACAMFLKY